MIVSMSRAYIAVRETRKDELLSRLGRMGLVHVQPVEPDKALGDEEIRQRIADVEQALQILGPVKAAHGTQSEDPLNAAREAVQVQASVIRNRERLKELHRDMEGLNIWGAIGPRQLEALREGGLEVRFLRVPVDKAGSVRAECVEPVLSPKGKRVLLALIDRRGEIWMPEGSEPVELPLRGRDSIVAEAKKLDMELKQASERLSILAASIKKIQAERDRLLLESDFIKAQRSGMSQGTLFAVQGWLPTEEAAGLESRLSRDGFPAAVLTRPPQEEEAPPTLIHYPGWARPIKALFDMLGTLPGYREMDLSPFFMLALPVFAAMLIGDAGYGLLIAILGIVFYKRMVRSAGRPKAQILVVFGVVTLVWGILTANYFGVTPETLARGAGFVNGAETGMEIDYNALWEDEGIYGRAARAMRSTGPLWVEDPKEARFLLIRVSLIIGCLHLILARLRKMVELIPDQRALAELGWIVVLGGMLVLIWHLLFVGVAEIPGVLWWVLLGAFLLSAWFGRPTGGVVKRMLTGFAASMLPLLNTFSDTMSYLRLFAVGLASYFIASAFNTLGARVADAATWFAAAPVLVFGHSLNIGLAAIAIFAHGVRLNMLEFSNNVGVQWAGYAYRPFTAEPHNTSGKELS